MTMKMMSSTSITSTSGVTLISAIGARRPRPRWEGRWRAISQIPPGAGEGDQPWLVEGFPHSRLQKPLHHRLRRWSPSVAGR
ncbi:hypothetical protein AB5I41_12635 [Sphingomonas sp. MMS24-JH45]